MVIAVVVFDGGGYETKGGTCGFFHVGMAVSKQGGQPAPLADLFR